MKNRIFTLIALLLSQFVNAQCSASFTDSVVGPLTVKFTNTSSSPSVGQFATYMFYYGDGNSGGLGIPGFSVNYTYAAPGTYTAVLVMTVYDSSNMSVACMDSSSFQTFTVVGDSVWPGDVNSDHVVDATDALDLALGYGSTGASRSGASISWLAQYCSNWGTNIVTGVDMKHADCDGNGTVNAADTAAINSNYGLTHPKTAPHAQHKTSGVPDLYFDLTGITLNAGTTVSVPIKLGSSSLPMNNILGLTAHVKISGITLGSPESIAYPTSWLGTSSNTYSFRKSISNNQVDWAYARNDHANTSGNGTMATLTFTIPSSASGQVIFSFENVEIINASGTVLSGYNVVDDTANIVTTGLANITADNGVKVYPNPSNGIFNITGQGLQNAEVMVTDIVGRKVYNSNLNMNNGIGQINLSNLTEGVYFININAGNTVYNSKIMLQH